MNLLPIFATLLVTGCATIHFRSNHSIPVTLEGNGAHQKEILVEGRRDFFWWGLNPEYHEVFVDEEVKSAGYPALSKAIIYEQKNPQDILISFLTLGIYMPRGWTITGFTEGEPSRLNVPTVTK